MHDRACVTAAQPRRRRCAVELGQELPPVVQPSSDLHATAGCRGCGLPRRRRGRRGGRARSCVRAL
eukprot:366203-Chlamydomonas_euryale.AAC.14